MSRRLLEIRRGVPVHDQAAYDLVWLELQRRVDDSGAHAWRFRSLADPGGFVEFLEFKADRDPRENPGIRERLRVLDEIAHGSVEELIDAPASPGEGKP